MDPLILTALFDDVLHDRLEADRRAQFPAERNMIPAHLTLFHALPGDDIDGVTSAVALEAAAMAPPAARIAGLMKLGRGWAWQVEAPPLRAMHDRLRDAFAGRLTAQDDRRPKLHVTVQNKAAPAAVDAAGGRLRAAPPPPDGVVTALALWHYRGGPWERAATFAFTGDAA